MNTPQLIAGAVATALAAGVSVGALIKRRSIDRTTIGWCALMWLNVTLYWASVS